MNKRYYYRTTGLEWIAIVFISLVVVQNLVQLIFEQDASHWMVLLNLLGLVVWGVNLLLLVWVLIVDRFDLAYIEIGEGSLTMKNPFLRTRRVPFDHTFRFKEKKGRLRKAVLYDESGKKVLVIGNGFDLSLEELKDRVARKKDQRTTGMSPHKTKNCA